MIKELTEKQQKTYDLLKDFASNNRLPFSIKAYQIGEQVGYKVTPGEKEGYEPSCSGAESCMQALKEKKLVDYDVRRHTGFIVKNIKVATFDERFDKEVSQWLKTFGYEYELNEVIKFVPTNQQGETENSVKIKINEISGEELQEIQEIPSDIPVTPGLTKSIKEGRMKRAAIQQEAVFTDIILNSLANLEEWRKKAESELIMLASRIDILGNENIAEGKVEIKGEADQEDLSIWRPYFEKMRSELAILSSRVDQLENANANVNGFETEEIGLKKKHDELIASKSLVRDMMYLARFFRTGVRRDNQTEAKKPEWQDFSYISKAINGGVPLIIDSYQHDDIPVAEMSGAMVVVLNARDYPKYFVSMNKLETELFNQCSEMFNEFDIDDFNFNSEGYCETRHWAIKRQQKFAANPSPLKCSKCLLTKEQLKKLEIPIQVHHKSGTYSRIFRENLEDLVILCKGCHEKEHPPKEHADNDN